MDTDPRNPLLRGRIVEPSCRSRDEPAVRADAGAVDEHGTREIARSSLSQCGRTGLACSSVDCRAR